MTITIEELLSYDDFIDGLNALKNDKEMDYLTISHFEKVEDLNSLNEEELEYYVSNLNIKSNFNFDFTELWNLDNSLCKFLLPRIYVFYKTDDSLQQEYDEGTWKEILESILEFLLLKLNYDSFVDKEKELIDKGKSLLFKYLDRLWN